MLTGTTMRIAFAISAMRETSSTTRHGGSQHTGESTTGCSSKNCAHAVPYACTAIHVSICAAWSTGLNYLSSRHAFTDVRVDAQACRVSHDGNAARLLRRRRRHYAARQVAKRYPSQRLGRAEDVGAAVVYLASAEAEWVTGQVVALNDGLVTA